MANNQPVDSRRPRTLHISRSFTRLESPQKTPDSPSRLRASTIQNPTIHTIPEARNIGLNITNVTQSKTGDIFESVEEDDSRLDSEHGKAAEAEAEVPQTFDQLPIEIRSLSDR